MRSRVSWSLVILSLLAALTVLGLVGQLPRWGFVVEVKNVGAQPMRSVVVHVPGASYRLGTVPPGKTASVTVRPTNEGGVAIELLSQEGIRKTTGSSGYIGPGYRGRIWFEMDQEQVAASGIHYDELVPY